MVAISVEQSMHFAMSMLLSVMGSFGTENLLMNQRKTSRMSTWNSLSRVYVFSSLSRFRERREHKIFEHMLTSIPGLQERLMECTAEETRMIADLVRRSVC